MRMTPCIAALPFLFMSGCVSLEGTGGERAAQPGSASTYYCWKDTLGTRDDKLVCNWEPSKGDACRLRNNSVLAKGVIASGPVDAGRCENGQWLVKVTTK